MEIWVTSQPDDCAAWEETVRRVLTRGLADLQLEDAAVSVLLTDNQTIAGLNAAWRGREEPTDVLSFSQREGEAADPDDPVLGDIVISIERALAQADDYGHPPEREVGFLAVHGLLHLVGYDHEAPDDEARMIGTTEAILSAVGLERG